MQYITEMLATIEQGLAVGGRMEAYANLRRLGLADFGSVLWAMPDKRFPRVSSVLPAMASDDTQRQWTGQWGHILLGQSVGFMRSVSANYTELTGESLAGKRILDFGCGYGRLLRLAAFYSNDVFGVDPWTESIRLCQEADLSDNLSLSEYLPSSLPVPHDFDVAYAFSVFTHLSERATKACLDTVRKHVKAGGIFCITIRPVEYWRMVYTTFTEADLADVESRHHDKGFAFIPHNRQPIDGDVTYGDTSMTLDWLGSIIDGWQIAATDRNIDDPVQRYVYLRAV